tara:strand:- start:209 stop:364 length:156 start_codon:yes stop_codon:yes gene_type:complete
MCTNCCGAHFSYPGLPDSDICANCGKHAFIMDIEDTLTEKEKKERSKKHGI